MQIVKFVEDKFWLLLVLALALGLSLPAFGKLLSPLIIPFLMTILFLTYLKTDFMEIIYHIKKPLFLVYIIFMFLLVIPAVIFGIFQFVNPELSIAFLLLCSMPAGVASPVFTSIVKGNTSLTIIVTLISHLIAPFTLLFLFFLFAQKILPIDFGSLSKTLFLLAFAPLVLAGIIKKTNQQIIKATTSSYSFINIVVVTLLVYTATAIQSNEILRNPFSTFSDILWLYALFIFLHLLGYIIAFWRNKEDKIALSVAKTYMNNSLALGLALAFFPPKIALIVVLANIPWNTTLGLFKFLLRYLK